MKRLKPLEYIISFCDFPTKQNQTNIAICNVILSNAHTYRLKLNMILDYISSIEDQVFVLNETEKNTNMKILNENMDQFLAFRVDKIGNIHDKCKILSIRGTASFQVQHSISSDKRTFSNHFGNSANFDIHPAEFSKPGVLFEYQTLGMHFV